MIPHQPTHVQHRRSAFSKRIFQNPRLDVWVWLDSQQFSFSRSLKTQHHPSQIEHDKHNFSIGETSHYKELKIETLNTRESHLTRLTHPIPSPHLPPRIRSRLTPTPTPRATPLRILIPIPLTPTITIRTTPLLQLLPPPPLRLPRLLSHPRLLLDFPRRRLRELRFLLGFEVEEFGCCYDG